MIMSRDNADNTAHTHLGTRSHSTWSFYNSSLTALLNWNLSGCLFRMMPRALGYLKHKALNASDTPGFMHLLNTQQSQPWKAPCVNHKRKGCIKLQLQIGLGCRTLRKQQCSGDSWAHKAGKRSCDGHCGGLGLMAKAGSSPWGVTALSE